AEAAGAANIRWVEGGSEDLERLRSAATPELGSFRLVTMGASFHWMEQAGTLQTLDKMMVDGGGIFIAGSPSIWSQEGDWQEALRAVMRRWLGETRRAGSSEYRDPAQRFEVTLSLSTFKRLETYKLEYQRTWDIDSLVGHLYSMSFSSPFVLGN